jgi:VWFA-related protein
MKKRIQVWCGVFLFLPAIAFAQEPGGSAVPTQQTAPAQQTAQAQQPAPAATQAPALAPRPADAAATAPVAGEGRIHLDVVVTDKAGKPVSGLALEDFTLKDNNLPAKILSFHAKGTAVENANERVEVIVLLDAVNLGFQSVARSRDQVAAFLRQNGGKLAQPVSVFVFGDDGIKVLLQPSTDGNALAAQLLKTDTALRTIGRSSQYGGFDRFDLSLKWIDIVAKSEVQRPGKKLLIWAGPGWPMLDRPSLQITAKGEQQMFEGIVDLSTTLREGQMSVYSVTMGEPQLGTYLYQDFLKGVKTAEKAQPSNMALKVLAVQSGGQVMTPDNDITAQIDRCVQDGTAYYSISFDPPRADKANEYHDLKVEVDKPGLTARTNTGYYNQP